MAKAINKLSARTVASLKTTGRYSDGDGLYLIVDRSGLRKWSLRYRADGKVREMGLGGLSSVTLAEARSLADKQRQLLRSGVDPIQTRKSQVLLPKANSPTFAECATRYIAAQSPGWRNPKHRAQWTNTLQIYAHPHIGRKPVSDIGLEDLKTILKPIWTKKTETATRVRGRIEKILDWAKVQNYRTGENPARWQGNLSHEFPPARKVTKPGHHAALPFAKIAAFMNDLRSRQGMAAVALEFAILTAARTGETIGARWTEFDLEQKVWTVPAERMKAGLPHRVPLSDRCIEIIKSLHRVGEFVFHGNDVNEPLSNMALLAVLRRMDQTVTTHGFRSTFRDWAAELTDYPSEVVEMALAHTIKNKSEAAYRRGDLLERRRALMNDWDTFIG